MIAPPPLIYLAAVGIGFAIDALAPSVCLGDAVRWPVGGALAAAGLGLMGSFVGAFRRAHTPVAPYEPSTAIVTGGPYRLTRNPGYLGMALVSAGIAVMTSRLWIFAALAIAIGVVDRGVIAREERYLEAKFGEQYLRYKRSARRWL